jgi:ABC-type oligopeptide transport system ATPase subunit
LRLYKGATLGLVGESGSGKSTVAKAVVGLVQPEAGKIEVFGRDIHSLNRTDRKRLLRRCQLIFQDPYGSMNPRLCIEDIIAEPLELHGLISKNRIGDHIVSLLGEVGLLPDYLHRYPHQLSGGQRQRVCIARALSLNPELLLCDEIVSALDVSVQAQILNLLKDVQESRQLTILFIGHDLTVVEFMSDEISVMKNGCIVEHGCTDDILKRPGHPYTRELIKASQLSTREQFANCDRLPSLAANFI